MTHKMREVCPFHLEKVGKKADPWGGSFYQLHRVGKKERADTQRGFGDPQRRLRREQTRREVGERADPQSRLSHQLQMVRERADPQRGLGGELTYREVEERADPHRGLRRELTLGESWGES